MSLTKIKNKVKLRIKIGLTTYNSNLKIAKSDIKAMSYSKKLKYIDKT